MSLLAVDIGSSACKAVVFAANGRVLAQHSSRYSPTFPRPSFAEMDPEKFWNAVCFSCRAATKNLSDTVRAVALSSHGETFVAVDSHNRPVRNAILNQDNRALEEAAWCEETIGRKHLYQITGLCAHPMRPIPKILWLRKHEREIFELTRKYLSLIGYLLLKMGFPPYIDYSLASRFLAFDIHKRVWSDEILATSKLDKNCFPEPVPAGTIVGKLDSEVASQLGVRTGTPVVLGGHDQPCGALGAGVISQGRVFISIGTYESLLAASDEPRLSDKALASRLDSYCHVVPDKYVTLAFFPSGIMVQWFHDLLCEKQVGEVNAEAKNENDEDKQYSILESHAPDGPSGLYITPHLIGTCNPEFDPHARALIYGLGPESNRSQIYKGIMEGLAFELAMLTEMLAEVTGDFGDIYATGGGTRSALGMQLRAALTGRRLHVLREPETVCLGTAMLAGVAIGEYARIAEATEALVGEDAVFAPNPGMTESYQNHLQRYKQLRSSVVHQT